MSVQHRADSDRAGPRQALEISLTAATGRKHHAYLESHWILTCRNLGAVKSRNAGHNRQSESTAQTRAGLVSSGKGSQELREMLRIDTLTVVPNGKEDRTFAGTAGDTYWRVSVIEGVLNQVGDQSLNR